jgi:glutathione S-transferase
MTQASSIDGAPHLGPACHRSELNWLDSKLADGRSYLVGGRFSRVDLTVPSLLAEFARPRELPVYDGMVGPDPFAADVERWSARPVMRWVIAQYHAHRPR